MSKLYAVLQENVRKKSISKKHFYFCCMKGNVSMVFLIGLLLFSCSEKKEKKVNATSVYLNELNKKIIKYPDSPALRLTLVKAMDSAGMYKEALAQMDVLISIDSLNHGFWFTKGNIQQNAADTAGAILSFNRAAKVYPSPEILLALANLYAETRNPKVLDVCARIDELKMGRELDSYTAFFKGVYFSRMGEKSKAIALFDKSINFNYTLMDNYIEKGSLYYEDKNYAEAMKVFKTAAAVNNSYAYAYYWQAKCFEAMNDKANAISNYNKAFVLDKKMKEAAAALKRLK